MSISQILVPNDLKLFIGNNQIQRRGTYNVNAVTIPTSQSNIIYQVAEQIVYTHSVGQNYLVSFSGYVDINHTTAPGNGQELFISPVINGLPIEGPSTVVSPNVISVSRFGLGYDYNNPPNLANISFSYQFVIKNINFVSGSVLNFNIRVTNTTGVSIIYPLTGTNMTVSCLNVV